MGEIHSWVWGVPEWERHSQLMHKPGTSETAGFSVPVWSLIDQFKDQKISPPSGKTSTKEIYHGFTFQLLPETQQEAVVAILWHRFWKDPSGGLC